MNIKAIICALLITTSSQAVDNIKQVNKQISAKETVALLAGIVLVIGCCVAAKQFYRIFPSAEYLYKEKLAAHLLNILRASKALNECLGRNRNAALNDDGMPVGCEEVAQAFITAAGLTEYGKIKDAFINR